MSTFAIYAFVVTGLYIVYMAVAILMDLFGKKGQKKDSSEVFNNADMEGDADEEHSTIVDETDGGYAIHHEDEEPPVPADDEVPEHEEVADDEDGDGTVQEEQPVDTNPDDEDLLEEESLESQAAYESLKAVQEKMDSVEPFYQEELRSEEYAFMMAQPISQPSRILRQITKL